VSPFTHHQRPDWALRSRLKSAQLQADASTQREISRRIHEQVLSLQAEIVKLSYRQRELTLARSRFKAENDPSAQQIGVQIADVVAELEALNISLDEAKKRYGLATAAASVANTLANAAAKALAAVTRTEASFSGNGISMSASSVSGA